MRRSQRIAAQKRNREEETEPLDQSKEEEKAADKKKRSNEETNDTSGDTTSEFSDMRRSMRIAAQKRNREEENEPLDLSKENEKKKRSNEETNDNSGDTNECSICLDTVENSTMKSLPCAHVFHETCINEWLKISKICPICRWTSTVETNDSPHVGEAGPRETFEVESNGNSGSEVGGWNTDFESESEESRDESESEESRYESESEESRDESESEESRDEFDGYSDMECYLM